MGKPPHGPLNVLRIVAPSLPRRSVLFLLVSLGTAIFLWMSPISPVALWRADVMLGHGHSFAATQHYDAIAKTNPLPWVRAAALERSALTWSVELGASHEARVRLEKRLFYRMSPQERARLLDRVGQLLLLEGESLDGARRLREAHDIAPELPDAAERLARAARAASQGGDLDLAERLWRRMGQAHEEHRARSEIGLANVALARGNVEEALASYEAAARAADDKTLASVASLGAATCLERLGDLDLALAELDAADLPPHVHERRAAQIRAREQIR